MDRLLPRDGYLEHLTAIDDRSLVRVITGVRRCGKSSLLRLYQEHLLQKDVNAKQILTINFEKLANDTLRSPETFHQYVLDQLPADQPTYLHVDEVQELEDWARTINSLRVSRDIEITVTGSNSSIFSGQGLTYLAGRYVEINMFPLSLAEFRRFRAVDKDTPTEVSYNEFLHIGGFPTAALMSNPRAVSDFNQALFDSIFARDIVARGNIRDTDLFIRIAGFLFDNIGSELSVNRIVSTFKSHGTQLSNTTVEKYLDLLVGAHMVYPCRRYDLRWRKLLTTGRKYYAVDFALRNSLLGHRSGNSGHDLENAVFIELLRRGFTVTTGFHKHFGEIDFKAQRQPGSDEIFIQVALTALDETVLNRELSSFQAVPPGAACFLITMDRIDLNTGHVKQINAADFLAGKVTLPSVA